MSDRTLLLGVTGGTGAQAVRGLREAGVGGLCALTRDPNRPGVRKLGIEAVAGDLQDAESVKRAMQGARFVYIHGLGADSSARLEQECAQAERVAAAAREAGVQHVVYNSNAGFGRAQGVALVTQKHDVERVLTGAGLATTMLRATLFMEEWWKAHNRPDVLGGVLKLAQPEHRAQSFVSVRDMGRAAARVLADPGAHVGAAIDMVGDTLTPLEMAAAFARVQGSDVRFQPLPESIFDSLPDFAALLRWYNEVGFDADTVACRRWLSGMWTFEEFLRATHWADHAREYGQWDLPNS